MAVEDIKTADIAATETTKSPLSTPDDSDQEVQKDRSYVSESAFESTEDHAFYRPIESYEGIHRWDPHFKWTEQEEKRIVRKVRHS